MLIKRGQVTNVPLQNLTQPSGKIPEMYEGRDCENESDCAGNFKLEPVGRCHENSKRVRVTINSFSGFATGSNF